MKKILGTLKLKDFEGPTMDLIKRLMDGENYQSKFASTVLIPAVYTQMSPAN